MNQPLGMTEFFAMEAGEYLERLDALVSASAPPNAKEFIRLSRALRGSALMASHQPIATAAAGLESLARAVSEARRPWDPGTRQTAIRGIDDLKILIRKLATWSAAEDQKARAIAGELEHAAGGSAPAAAPRQPTTAQDAGTRAFVAREGAAVASALDRAARTLAENPATQDQLGSVLKVMQPLRGLAALAELPPLPDLLEGIERAVGDIARRKGPVPVAAALFQAAAQALSRATREVVASGKPAPDSAEVAEFARLLREALETEADVVPIETLFPAGSGPHMVHRGTVPTTPATVSRLELVAHGEHLRLAADGLERAETGAQRDLRIQAVGATFRALAGAGGGPLAAAAAGFAAAAREAVASGLVVRDARAFAANLREIGIALSSPAPDESGPANRVSALTTELRRMATAAAALPAALAGPRTAPSRDVAPTPAATVAAPPGGRGAAEAPPRASAPTPSPATEPAPVPGSDAETPDLVGSVLRFERYLRDLGGPPSLDEFLAGPPADPARAAPAAPSPDVVEIAALCYSGQAALERALSLRTHARAALSNPSADRRAVQELLEEVFDLVQLGLASKS